MEVADLCGECSCFETWARVKTVKRYHSVQVRTDSKTALWEVKTHSEEGGARYAMKEV